MSVGRFLARAWRTKVHIRVSTGEEPDPGWKSGLEVPHAASSRPDATEALEERPSDETDPPGTTRTFFAESPSAAFRQAESELGPDAVLIATCRTSHELSHLGRYQVTFALSQSATPLLSSPVSTGPSCRLASVPAAGEEFASMLLQHFAAPPNSSERIATIQQPVRPRTPFRLDDREKLLSTLVEQGILPRIAQSLLEEAEHLLQGSRAAVGRPLLSEWTSAVRSVLQKRICTDSSLPSRGRRAVLLAGPSGSGKTVAAARLAIHAFTDLIHARTHILSLSEPYQEAPSRLCGFCGLLGLQLSCVSSIEALDSALQSIPAEDLAIIDTPGFSGRGLSALEPLSRYLGRRKDIQVHLVLSAASPENDASQLVSRFEVLQPCRLLFTMLDRTPSRAVVLNQVLRTRKPLSFFSKGPSFSDVLIPAEPEELIDGVVPPKISPSPGSYANAR